MLDENAIQKKFRALEKKKKKKKKKNKGHQLSIL